ncbi:sulfatase [Oceanococcus atlanticus]|uniref:Sulfatase n=1 Tax=Oceanococcus atlanticus TaxID=1317117 RepID=A0A1Y1SFH2_9GAMM|nr:arylsulfatase [Oceanococcus atlanticus]ORE88414.1 sulfatase [Oceanococcus atlanticus]
MDDLRISASCRCLIAVTLALGVFGNAAASTAERPNIVLIMADDLGYTDLGVYGGEVSTPNINALAERGTLLTSYHTSPLCSPSRAMLMTGVESHRAGLGNLPETTPLSFRGEPAYLGRLNERVETLATRLKRAGYRTYMTGKWHLGKDPRSLPNARGFDRSFALEASGADNWEQKPYLPIYPEAPWYEDGHPTTLPDDFYSSRFLVDKLIEYIDSGANQNNPFFAYLAFQAVHIPVQAPREYVERYNGVYDAGWDAIRKARHERAVELGIVDADAPIGAMPEGLRDWNQLDQPTRERLAMNMQVNAGMIEAMDHHIGRLIEHLKASGDYDNTTFVFLSDNGPEHNDPLETPGMALWLDWVDYSLDLDTLGEKGTYGYIGPEFASAAASPHALFKFYTGEGGVRVPAIFSGASIPGPAQIRQPSFVIDIAPTLLEIAGVSRDSPEGIEAIRGRSLLSALQQSEQPVREDQDIVAFETAGNVALFMGDYKLSRNRPRYGDGQWKLFNIATDPGETRDLSADQPERFRLMREHYDAWAEDVGALEVPEGYDARRQLSINSMHDRALRYGPWLLLALVVLVMWRRQRKNAA